MAKVALSKDFMTQFQKLNRDVQKKVNTALGKFQADSSLGGLNLESYNAAADPRARTIRVDDFWRAILAAPESGSDTYIVFAVKSHDDADRWMQNNTFSVNALTGAIEVLNAEAVGTASQSSDGKDQDTAASVEGFLAGRSVKEFRQVGIVDEDMIDLLRSVPSEDQLIALAGALPMDQGEALVGLMCGDPVEKIYAQLLATNAPAEEPAELEPVPVEKQDLAAAVEKHNSRASFRVVDGPDELAMALLDDFEAWRTFLHPAQLAVVERNYRGPARITGGAGTGKTVALLHRAKRLAESSDENAKILVTTFTRRLSGELKLRLKQLGGNELADRIKVSTVDSLARTYFDGKIRVPNHWSLLEIAREAVAETSLDELDLSARFLLDEWEQVVLAHRIRSRKGYFQVKRSGRGIRLDRRKRAKVWAAVEIIESTLAARNQRTFLQVADEAAEVLGKTGAPPFTHVLVDEAQDLHPAQWRLLRAAAVEGENDLFIAGDTHQRIYDNRVTLSRLGIEIRGRSSRLKLNYRTTRQILTWSLCLLAGEEFDDLDDGAEILMGYRSATEGPDPEVVSYPDFAAELDGLVDRVRSWRSTDAVAPAEIGVAVRTNGIAQQVRTHLAAADLPVAEAESAADAITVDTMHSMKGLEFRCVAIADVSEGSMPPDIAVAPIEEDALKHAQDLQRERCLLYVAATRAREQLHVSYSGPPSDLLSHGNTTSG